MPDKQYRISWTLNGHFGRGDWGIDYDSALSRIAELNHEYGPGTHWLESK